MVRGIGGRKINQKTKAMTTQEAKQKAHVITAILKLIAETIKGNNGTPSGTIYAALSAHGCTLQQYTGLIDAFKQAGKVREVYNLLYWID